MAEYMGSLAQESRYKVDDFVDEIVGRRDAVFTEMREQIRTLVTGLLDQFTLAQKQDGVQPHAVRFERVRWVREGRIVIDVSHNRRALLPPSFPRWD